MTACHSPPGACKPHVILQPAAPLRAAACTGILKMAERKYVDGSGAGAEAAQTEQISADVESDIRKRIRSLKSHQYLDVAWMKMANTLKEIAQVAFAEMKNSEADKDATLWEGDTVVTRILLEEGRSNLCLRNLIDYKALVPTGLEGSCEANVKLAELIKADSKLLMKRMIEFEKGTGLLLQCAFRHVEAIQTIDMPMLIEHIALMLTHANAMEDPSSIKELPDWCFRQEFVTMFYLSSIGEHMEDAVGGEEAICANLDKTKLVPLLVCHLNRFKDIMNPNCMQSAFRFLADVCATESFATHPDDFFPDAESKKGLADLKAPLTDRFIKDMDDRKEFRPVLDAMSKFERGS